MTQSGDTKAELSNRARRWFASHGQPLGGGTPRRHDLDAYISAGLNQQKGLFDASLAGITWPKAYGGLGLDAEHQMAFNEVAREYELYGSIFTVGHGLCAPVLLAIGSEEQKQRYLRPMLNGEEFWCQLFSEPEAGSDLASLTTKAVSSQGGYLLTGQKVWTSHAQYASHGLVLARTDASLPKHAGLSMFIVDMRTAGIDVRPLRQATGENEFCEVFFDGAYLPPESLVGQYNGGWSAAMLMLMNERLVLGREDRPTASPVDLARLVRAIRARGMATHPQIRERVAELYVRQRSLDLFSRRIARQAAFGQDPGPICSVGKLATARLAKDVSKLAVDVCGEEAIAWDPSDTDADIWAYGAVYAPLMSIAGGTEQIQLSILGERILNLPRPPR
jgi:alkylation response protein AidB-like acyl-CoA dehydrogenase